MTTLVLVIDKTESLLSVRTLELDIDIYLFLRELLTVLIKDCWVSHPPERSYGVRRGSVRHG